VSATLQQLLLQSLKSQQSQYRLGFEQSYIIYIHCEYNLGTLLKNVFIRVREGKGRRFFKMAGFPLIKKFK